MDKINTFNELSPDYKPKWSLQECKDETKAPDVLELAKSLRIDPTEEIKPLEAVIKFKDAILGTLGDFSLIIGKAKSRKSFYLVLLTVTLLIDELYNAFTGHLPNDKRKILYFDTEQSKAHVQWTLWRICKLSGLSNPENIEVYHLRSLSPVERLEFIQYKIENTPNLGFVFIDGIKDLITSINDEEQASMIASKLLKWTEVYNIHITVVLHQNKSDNNARGHLGTELVNKAGTVLSVSKADGCADISVVMAEMCRNKEPEPFAFEIVDGLPVEAENHQIRTETRNQKFDISELEDWQIFQLLNEAFSKEKEQAYFELITQIKLAFKKQYSKTLGETRTRELITLAKNNGWIEQEKKKAPYTLGVYNGDEKSDDNGNDETIF